jgi:hypothetical protein
MQLQPNAVAFFRSLIALLIIRQQHRRKVNSDALARSEDFSCDRIMPTNTRTTIAKINASLPSVLQVLGASQPANEANRRHIWPDRIVSPPSITCLISLDVGSSAPDIQGSAYGPEGVGPAESERLLPNPLRKSKGQARSGLPSAPKINRLASLTALRSTPVSKPRPFSR